MDLNTLVEMSLNWLRIDPIKVLYFVHLQKQNYKLSDMFLRGYQFKFAFFDNAGHLLHTQKQCDILYFRLSNILQDV